MMPSSHSLASRSVSTLRATPRVVWKSSNRLTPSNALLTTSKVQRSPTTSRARAIEQFWLSYVRGSTPFMLIQRLHDATPRGRKRGDAAWVGVWRDDGH